MGLRTDCLTSVAELRGIAAAWDRLWEASEAASALGRAEAVALWIEHFAPNAPLHVLSVEQDGEMVAALPLVAGRRRSLLSVGDVTGNYWSPGGELLLAPRAGLAVVDALARALIKTPWPLLWFDVVPFETPRWKLLVGSLAGTGRAVEVRPRYPIGQIEIQGTFADYLARCSRSHRQGLRKKLRRLERCAAVTLREHDRFGPDELPDLLRRGFEIETRNWKGNAGATVLGTPGMLAFFERQARLLAEWGCLRLYFLEVGGEAIAFEYGWTSKGVYHCFKIGYDDRFARYSPGQLLRMRVLERLFERPGLRLVDFQGPLTDAVACWCTRTYPAGRLVFAPDRWQSRLMMAGYRTLVPVIHGLRGLTGGLTAGGEPTTPMPCETPGQVVP